MQTNLCIAAELGLFGAMEELVRDVVSGGSIGCRRCVALLRISTTRLERTQLSQQPPSGGSKKKHVP